MPILPGITLQPHQQSLRDDAAEAAASGTPFRRMTMWGVGTGKTIGALGAVDALGGSAGVVTPAAVRPSFRADTARTLGTKLPIVSYHGAASGKLPPPDTLVIDESQRLGSTGAQSTGVTNLAQKARNVLLLSGTPIRNHPRELANAVSILSGHPMSQDEFSDRFVGSERHRPGGLFGWLRGEPAIETPVVSHPEELKNLLKGKIDYYENSTPPAGAPSDVKYEDVESTMTSSQANLYKGMFEKLPYMLRWKLKWSYPLSDQELVRARSFLTGPRQIGLSDLPYRHDKNPLNAFENSGKLRMAMSRLQLKLSDPRAKAIVYSNFLHAGLRPYAAALEKSGIPHAIFHGGLSDEERSQLVSHFNDGKLKVALVAPAGAEGISLKGAQLIQLLDPHFNDSRMRQAQARGIRFDSHTGLPEDLRGVTVERHVAKLPLGLSGRLLSALGVDRESQRAGTDDYLRALSTRKEKLNTQFLDLLKEVSSENTHRREKGASLIQAPNLMAEARAGLDGFDRGDLYLLEKMGRLLPDLASDSVLHGQMRNIKAMSDLGTPEGYAQKTQMLRTQIAAAPADWRVDSELNPEFLGVTHKSGWRFHIRKRDVIDLLPQAAPSDKLPQSGPQFSFSQSQ